MPAPSPPSPPDPGQPADRLGGVEPHPRFDEAVEALDAGDLESLRRLLDQDPGLARARGCLDPPYGYFTGATLLHHVAGNPSRGRLGGARAPLGGHTVAAARLLLDAGADVHALTLGPTPADTMGLLVTSKQASDAGVTGPLMDLLLAHGARLDVGEPGALDAPLANHAPRAAEKMLELGAELDVLAAAGLGRLDLLRDAFDDRGRLCARPRRQGRLVPERDAIGLALLFAYVRGERAAVDFLIEKDGNWNVVGVGNGTALHRAASAGDVPMVRRLVARGADVNDRNNPFCATPLSWARHGGQDGAARWIEEHCAVDLHDAVCFDLRAQIEARLRADPASVHRRLDQWDIPAATPLHWAAALDRTGTVRLLLDAGADVNAAAANGHTPLDLAESRGAAAAAALLREKGARRSSAP